MHTHTHTHPANRHPFIPVQHGPLTPGSPKKLWPRCPPPLQVHEYRTGIPILRLQPALPGTLSVGRARSTFPLLKSIPHPCAHTCVLTPAEARKGTAGTRDTSQGVWGRSCSSLGQRWAWAVNPGSGNKRLCTGTAQELLLLLQVVAFEQKWHLQTLDMQLSNQGPRITPDRGNCQLSPLGEKC